MLCGGKRRCCPSVSVEGNEITIQDDYGGKVILTRAEVREFKKIEV
jgi:hypothetical protein